MSSLSTPDQSRRLDKYDDFPCNPQIALSVPSSPRPLQNARSALPSAWAVISIIAFRHQRYEKSMVCGSSLLYRHYQKFLPHHSIDDIVSPDCKRVLKRYSQQEDAPTVHAISYFQLTSGTDKTIAAMTNDTRQFRESRTRSNLFVCGISTTAYRLLLQLTGLSGLASEHVKRTPMIRQHHLASVSWRSCRRQDQKSTK